MGGQREDMGPEDPMIDPFLRIGLEEEAHLDAPTVGGFPPYGWAEGPGGTRVRLTTDQLESSE